MTRQVIVCSPSPLVLHCCLTVFPNTKDRKQKPASDLPKPRRAITQPACTNLGGHGCGSRFTLRQFLGHQFFLRQLADRPIKWLGWLRLEVERPLTRRRETRFGCERALPAWRHQCCLARRPQGPDRGQRKDPTKVEAPRGCNFPACQCSRARHLRRPPKAAPRWRRGRTTSGCARRRRVRACLCLRPAKPRVPPGLGPRGSMRW